MPYNIHYKVDDKQLGLLIYTFYKGTFLFVHSEILC